MANDPVYPHKKYWLGVCNGWFVTAALLLAVVVAFCPELQGGGSFGVFWRCWCVECAWLLCFFLHFKAAAPKTSCFSAGGI